MPPAELHIISNGVQTLDAFAEIAGTIHPFVDVFHLRERSKSARELWQGLGLLSKAGVILDKIMINDRIDVAWAANVKGVQLAYHSLDVRMVKHAFPGLRIGRSVHSLAEAEEMERQGADYLVFGHVFPTLSKPGLQPKGLAALEQVVKQVAIPVIAIGGIKPEQVTQVLNAGAAGIAVMSGVVAAEHPLSMVKEYYSLLHK